MDPSFSWGSSFRMVVILLATSLGFVTNRFPYMMVNSGGIVYFFAAIIVVAIFGIPLAYLQVKLEDVKDCRIVGL